MSNQILEEMIRFQTDRRINEEPFDMDKFTINLFEEILELHGIKDTKSRRFAISLFNDLQLLKEHVELVEPERTFEVTDNTILDAICDISEFSVGEPLKMGYNPIICLREMAEHINSRTGTIIDGKFQKDTSPEAKKRWYEPRYELAKIKPNKYKTGNLFEF